MRLRSATRFVASCLLALCAVAAGSPDAAPAPAAWLGVWIQVDAEADEARRSEAIERSTSAMPTLIRPIARAAMRRSGRPASRHEIRAGHPGLSIRTADEPPVGARLDGELDRDPNAEVRSWRRGDGFEQRWRTDASTHGRTRWRFDPEGLRLSVTTRIENARFSAPLIYTSHYARQQPIDEPSEPARGQP